MTTKTYCDICEIEIGNGPAYSVEIKRLYKNTLSSNHIYLETDVCEGCMELVAGLFDKERTS